MNEKKAMDYAQGLTIDEIEITKQVAVNTMRTMEKEVKKFNLSNDIAMRITLLVIKIINESTDDIIKKYMTKKIEGAGKNQRIK